MMPYWLRFSLRKGGRLLLLLLCASLVCFLLLAASPVDPLSVNVGQAALGSLSAEQIDQLRAYWGADVPIAQRYLSWLSGVLRGDMGLSLRLRIPVTQVIDEKLGASLMLVGVAWVFSGVLGFVLGMVCARFQGRFADRLIRGYCALTASTPAFYLALLLLLVFAVWFPLLPLGFAAPVGVSSGAVRFTDSLRHAILPALSLSLTGVSGIALHTREKAVGLLQSDAALYARARGESPRRILFRHVLRGALIPALTLQLASFGELIGASVLIEQVFSYPGLGQAAVTAGLGGDAPLLLGITMLCSTMVFLGNFAADLLAAALDPRQRQGRAAR